jgi:type II secretory pathway pseudopilin PulG
MHKRPTHHQDEGQRGFTYLWLLFLLAIGGATMAAIGERASTAVLRDREAELNFRGLAIASAIGSYWAAGATLTEDQERKLPKTLQDLLEDRRGPVPLRHLRQLYADPYTGQTDWVLVLPLEGTGVAGIVGVRSRASALAFRTADAGAASGNAALRVSDRVFKFSPTDGAITEIDPPPSTTEGLPSAPP